VRPGLPVSVVAHAGLVAAAVVALPRAVSPLPAAPVIPVTLIQTGPVTSIAAQEPEAPEAPAEEPAAEAQPEPEPAPALAPQPEAKPVAATPAPKAPPAPPQPRPKAQPQAAPRPPAPAQPRTASTGLDLDRISALADQSETAAPRRAAQMTTAQGQPRRGERRAAVGLAGALTASDVDALRSQIARCWRAPADLADAERLIVEVRIELDRDGALVRAPEVVRPGVLGGADPQLRAAAESAVRAVRSCAPFDLSPEGYDAWRTVRFVFDPRLMAAAG
jgi:outer membrane biosynthesis protein TonB